MHKQSTTIAVPDPLARHERHAHDLAVARAHLLSAVDALDARTLAVAVRVGAPPVRRAAADVRHLRTEVA